MVDCSNSRMCQGAVLMVIGLVLLLNILGILKETTNLVISIAAGAMILYGFYLCGGFVYIKNVFKRQTEKK